MASTWCATSRKLTRPIKASHASSACWLRSRTGVLRRCSSRGLGRDRQPCPTWSAIQRTSSESVGEGCGVSPTRPALTRPAIATALSPISSHTWAPTIAAPSIVSCRRPAASVTCWRDMLASCANRRRRTRERTRGGRWHSRRSLPCRGALGEAAIHAPCLVTCDCRWEPPGSGGRV